MDAAAPKARPVGNAAEASTHARLVNTSVSPCPFLPNLQCTAFFAAAILLFALPGVAGEKHAKPVQIEVLEFAAHRSESLIGLDAHVRNAGDKPVRGLTLTFTFTNADKTTLTTQRATADEESLAPGDDASVHAQIDDPAGAVYITLSASDSRSFELRISQPGPYTID